jgi:cytochrome P450
VSNAYPESDDFIHCRLGRSAQFLFGWFTAVVASLETTDLLDSASPTFADRTLAAFGSGAHYCLSATLARLETTVALRHSRPQPY